MTATVNFVHPLVLMADDDDYLSDLTELQAESDEDEEFSKSKKPSLAKGKSKTWKVSRALKPPRATTYSAQALYGKDEIYLES